MRLVIFTTNVLWKVKVDFFSVTIARYVLCINTELNFLLQEALR